MSSETYDANIRVRDLPRSANVTLDQIAQARNKPKWEIVRAALLEFIENHRDELLVP